MAAHFREINCFRFDGFQNLPDFGAGRTLFNQLVEFLVRNGHFHQHSHGGYMFCWLLAREL